MKARTATGRTAFRARLAAAGCGALTILGIATLSACSGSASPAPAVSSFTIAGASTSTGTGSAAAGSTSSPGVTAHVTTPGITAGETTSGESTPATSTPTPTVTVTHTVTTTPTATQSTQIPSGAPVTGGGGTAGFQDGLLLAVGAAAIVAGAGSIVYRRRLTKNR
jgi:hypothetical protein